MYTNYCIIYLEEPAAKHCEGSAVAEKTEDQRRAMK